jgi:hypothetical protein
MTKQEIFDKVVDHMATQGKFAVSEEGYCQYKNEDDDKCAIGALIPDELYIDGLEMHNINELLNSSWCADVNLYLFDLLEDYERKDRFYLDLQNCHDESFREGGVELYMKLDNFSNNYDLDKVILKLNEDKIKQIPCYNK